jgi:hypothetical protein
MAWDSTPSTSSSSTSSNSRKKVAVIIPHTGWLHTEFIQRTLIPLIAPVDFCEKIPMLSKAYGITVGRNEGVLNAIQAGCDYILWVDSDMVLESVGTKKEKRINPETKKEEEVIVPYQTTDPNLALKAFFEFMENNPDVKVMSGLYRAKKKEGFPYAAWAEITEGEQKGKYITYTDFKDGNLIPVDAIGLGFCLMKTEPLKKMGDRDWFIWNMGSDLSEDFYLCKKLRESGTQIFLYTDIRLSHFGDLCVKSNGEVRVREA